MTLNTNTTGDETPNNNTRTSDEDNNNSNNTTNNTTKNGTRKKKKKKKGNGAGGHDEKKFEGLSKLDAFKGVVLECGKPAIQARFIRDACITYANEQKQARVADSILYNTQLEASDFVNAVENPAAYQYQEGGATKENAEKKKAEEKRVDYMIKLQTQEHQQALTLTQSIFNTVCGKCLNHSYWSFRTNVMIGRNSDERRT